MSQDPKAGPQEAEAEQGEVTHLLMAWERGDQKARDGLMEILYPHLRRLAAHKLAEGGGELSLRPTELVHEAYLRLVDQRRANWRSRGHFFALSARLMRRLIVDHARHGKRQKRGAGAVHIPLDELELIAAAPAAEILALDTALRGLASIDASAARLVDLRYFIGLTIDEAAQALGLSRTTAVRRWRYAKAWLGRELGKNSPS